MSKEYSWDKFPQFRTIGERLSYEEYSVEDDYKHYSDIELSYGLDEEEWY